jgi:hypothetical protein
LTDAGCPGGRVPLSRPFPTLGARTFAALLAASVAVASLGAADPDPTDAAAAANDDASAADEPVLIRFNFKGATFDQVIDFFHPVQLQGRDLRPGH